MIFQNPGGGDPHGGAGGGWGQALPHCGGHPRYEPVQSWGTLQIDENTFVHFM